MGKKFSKPELSRKINGDMLHLAVLIHGIGKPAVRQGDFSPDHPGMHHGHAAKSAQLIREQVIPGMLAHNIPWMTKHRPS